MYKIDKLKEDIIKYNLSYNECIKRLDNIYLEYKNMDRDDLLNKKNEIIQLIEYLRINSTKSKIIRKISN